MRPAHIKDMDRLFFIVSVTGLSILALLFFPIYLDTEAYYDMNGRKCTFCVNAYRIIKLLGGYIATFKGGLAVHLSPKKAVLLPYMEMNKERKRFAAFRSFRLRTFRLTMETGAEYLMPIALLQSILKIYFFTTNKKANLMESNLWLTDGDVLRISLQMSIRFNLFILLRNIINHWKEEIKLLCQTKM